MPKKLEDCVARVKARRQRGVNPWAVCVASTGLKPHKGQRRPVREPQAGVGGHGKGHGGRGGGGHGGGGHK